MRASATGVTSTPSKRSSKLSRLTISPPDVWSGTPTKLSRGSLGTPTGNITYLDVTWDENTQRIKATKRPRTEEESPIVRKHSTIIGVSAAKEETFLSLMNKLSKSIKTLKKEVESNRNTKVEIKEVTQHIASIMSQLSTDNIRSVLDNNRRGEEMIREPNQEERSRAKKSVKDCGTQYEIKDTDLEVISRKEKILNVRVAVFFAGQCILINNLPCSQ